MSPKLLRVCRILLFVALLFSVRPLLAQDKRKADSSLFDPVLTKANASLGFPKVADSLARWVLAKAKTKRSYDYIGRAATMLLTIKLTNDFPHAKPWYDTATLYLGKAKNHLWLGYANQNMGVTLNNSYRFEQGIPYLLKATKNFEQARDTAMLAYTYAAISNAFHDLGNYANGKKYANVAVATLQQSKKPSPKLMWRALCALAINYDDNGEWDKALAVHFRNLKNATGIDSYLASNYNNIGNTYQKKKDFPKAAQYLKAALDIIRKHPDDYQFATTYNNLANVNQEMGKTAVAGRYVDSALHFSKLSRSPEKLIDTYENAYKYADRVGNYRLAATYMNNRMTLKDSVFNADRARSVYDAQVRYETEKKEKENQRLQYLAGLRAVAQSKAESDRRFTIYIALGAVLALTLIFILVYRNTSARNRYAAEQKLNKALLDGEQNERIRIARDLHDSIGQLLSVIKMNLSNLNLANKTESLNNTVDLVDRTITEVRHISHNLLPEELNFGLFPALEDMAEKVNKAGVTKVLVAIPENARQHQFERANELSVYRIVQEALSNIVKHAQAANIELTVSFERDTMFINIKDDGQGFDTGQVNNSAGLGWKNMAARVNLMNGNLQVRSEKLKGTQIEISIPR